MGYRKQWSMGTCCGGGLGNSSGSTLLLGRSHQTAQRGTSLHKSVETSLQRSVIDLRYPHHRFHPPEGERCLEFGTREPEKRGKSPALLSCRRASVSCPPSVGEQLPGRIYPARAWKPGCLLVRSPLSILSIWCQIPSSSRYESKRRKRVGPTCPADGKLLSLSVSRWRNGSPC